MNEAMKNRTTKPEWTAVNEPFGSAVTSMSRQDFVTRYAGRFLCVLLEESDSEDTPAFRTLGGVMPPRRGGATLHVYPLVKRDAANPFSMMITFGRAPNNDLYVELSQVSKFHGYFSQAGEAWQVTDAGSTNGTYVDGVRLEPRRPALVEPGSQLRLGEATAWYLDSWGLFDLLLRKESATF